MSVRTEELVDVAAFGIEADHPRNSDLLIQGIENCRLRSAIKPVKMIRDQEEGEEVIRPVNAWMIDGLPSHVPGMQLHVNPEKLTWAVVDPLEADERMLERIRKAIVRQTGFSVMTKLKAVPKKEGTIDKDRMKTLVREMVNLVKLGDAKVVKGMIPAMEDVDGLPGDYLLNSSNRNNWHQPKYEKELPEFENRLHSMAKQS